ncbi:hypothetical protein FRC10_002018 [Ceratobasidium sp. 414]|nr:hypothetical protein FRC10_002018 [Ceratobasidium sp. 414]
MPPIKYVPIVGDRKPSAAGPSKKPHSPLSPDAALLTRIIKNTGQPILQQTLLSSVTRASPSDLDVLKRMLGPLVTAALNPLHCVRCHKSYVEQENNYRSCEIPHVEPEDVDSEPSSDDYDYESDEDGYYGDSDRKGGMMKFPCCGERFREADEDKQMKEPCVSKKHTTNPKEVEYYVGPVGLPPEQKNGPIDFGRRYKRYEGQNTNVITCQEAGCASTSSS